MSATGRRRRPQKGSVPQSRPCWATSAEVQPASEAPRVAREVRANHSGRRLFHHSASLPYYHIYNMASHTDIFLP